MSKDRVKGSGKTKYFVLPWFDEVYSEYNEVNEEGVRVLRDC